MYLDRFSPTWQEFHRRQLAQTRVLVIDDDPGVTRSLAKLLRREGYTADTAGVVEEAWPLLEKSSYDLILVDKTMPGESGLQFLEQMRELRIDIPTILITGDASTETVDQALALGAEDYISKPFTDTEHLLRRLRSVLDRRITSLLFDVVINDLTKAVHSSVSQSDAFLRMSRDILQHKLALGQRPPCIVIDDDLQRASARQRAICEAGVIAHIVAPDAITQFEELQQRPLAVIVDLEIKSALPLIDVLRARYPQIELFACASHVDLDTVLRAVSAGASEFALLQETGKAAFARRVVRLVRQTRRHHLYLGIVEILHRAAREARPELAEDLIFARSEPGVDQRVVYEAESVEAKTRQI